MNEMDDELRPEYDLRELLRGGVWGKYAARYRAGTNLVLLDPDVARAFPDEEAVKEVKIMAQFVGAEVMLDEKKWDRLRILAEREGKTPTDFLRALIEDYLEEQERLEEGRFLRALEELRQIRERNAARWGVYEGDLMGEVREERM